ncbi:MAG: kelch repeat-containing protein [Desulfomonilia bacterium]|jgi:N-acetylneuraminic acid mutarotase
MIIFGGLGENGTGSTISDNSRYNPSTDTWASISTINAPSSRFKHSAVWSGKEMIIWGGWDALTGFATNNGGKYIP